MKKIIVGTKELEVLDCYPFEYTNGKRELRVKLLQSKMDILELHSLFKENEESITYVEDDVTKGVYVGYKSSAKIELAEEEEVLVYNAVIPCVLEVERQVLELQKANKSLKEDIIVLTENNAMLTECVLEMSEAVYA